MDVSLIMRLFRRSARGLSVGFLAGLFRILGPIGHILRTWVWTASVRAKAARVGSRVYVYGPIYFQGTGNVRLGSGGNLYDNVVFETEEGGIIEMGSGFTVNRGVVLSAHSRIKIGDNALIGEYVSIRDSDHAFEDPDRPLRDQGFTVEPVCIGDDVWIGRGSAILRGAVLGDGCVVGANSVVTKCVPPMEVWAGVPARFLRRRQTLNPP